MERENKQSSYEMGIQTYQDRINALVVKITETSTDWEILNTIEEVERLELAIKQNERRELVLVKGYSINDPCFYENEANKLPVDNNKTTSIQ